MAYLDFKNLNKTDSNFWKKKNDLVTEKDEKNVMNKSENNINKQKILDISNGNKNKTSENNNQKQNEPKKKAGILDFLRAFKEMVAPFNLRKKTSRNTENDNNSANISKNNIKENLNKSDNKDLGEKNKIRNNYNTINTTKNEMDNNIKNNVYERRKVSVNSKNDEYNYNYYSDSAYDSCPLPNNQKNLNNYKSPNYFKKNNLEGHNNSPFLSYSQKNIFNKKNYNNNDDIQYKGISESSPDITNKINYKNKNNKIDERPIDNSLFNIFGIKNNKIYRKSNNNFNDKNNPDPLNDINYSSAYIKKTKKRIFSPNHSSKSENINNDKYNLNINNEKEVRKFSFNNNINGNNNINNNYNNINFNNINIGREIKNKNIDRQRVIESYDREKYNSENINENLNINAEKKIQEIKININYKRNNNNNINNYGVKQPLNSPYNHSEKKLYSTMNDFLPIPKPKPEIESCIINFDKNNNKPRKIYENNLYNKANTPNNINNNINNNNNFDLNNNFSKPPLEENYYSYSYSNIHDIRNNNFQNIYSKPNNKNNNINPNERNIRRGKNLSFGDLNLDINNKNINVSRPIKKKLLINPNEKINKINRFADSKEFDNDVNSVNSDNSSQNTSKEFNRTQLLPNSQVVNSIYSKPYKSFIINNKQKANNSSNNSFQNILRMDSTNSKYNTDFGVNYNYKERDLNLTNPGISKSNKNIMDKITVDNNNMSAHLNRNNNLSNTDSNININKNYGINSNNQMIYAKKPNSSKNNNKFIAINNVTPIPTEEYNLVNDNKINNIKAIIRPKIAQTKNNFIQKLCNYIIKYPKIDTKDNYFSKKSINIKIFKMPLKQISLYTKFYYKILQKPTLKNNYIDKKRIKIKRGLKTPKSEICFLTKKNLVYDASKIVINEEIKKHFKDDNLYKLSKDLNEVEPKKEDNNLNEENKDNIKEEKQINLDEDLEEKIEVLELEKNKNENININEELKNKRIKFSTPTQNIRENANEIISPKFASKSDKNPEKSIQNKIISIEIQLNNKDKNLAKNLSSSYNNISPNINTKESLYIKKKPSINNFMNSNINSKLYSNTENNKCKTYVKPAKRSNDEININNFNDDSNLDPYNNYSNKSNKIICIDIDLTKEQKKIQEQKEKEIRTYKRPTLPPLIDPTKN